jgi:hypothetical protein
MENMRSVFVHHDAGCRIALGVAVSGHVRPGVENVNGKAGLGQFPGHDSAGKARANNRNVIHAVIIDDPVNRVEPPGLVLPTHFQVDCPFHKRYLFDDVPFFWLALKQRLGLYTNPWG